MKQRIKITVDVACAHCGRVCKFEKTYPDESAAPYEFFDLFDGSDVYFDNEIDPTVFCTKECRDIYVEQNYNTPDEDPGIGM